MGYSRRSVLWLVGSCVGLSAAGAAWDDRGRSPPAQSGVTSRRETSSDVVGREQPADDGGETTAADAEPSVLANRTADVLDELSWFASEYDDAVDAFRSAADDVLTAVSDAGASVQLSDTVVARLDGETDRPRLDRGWPYDVWWDEGERRWRYADIDWQEPTDEVTDERPLSAGAIADLRTETEAFVDTFESELDPHFSGLDAEASFATDTMDTVAAFNDRGDIAMVVAGLVRLHEHYEAISSAAYVEDSLSDGPIRNRLAGYLKSPVPTSRTALFEVDYRADGVGEHLAFVYDDSVDQTRRDELYAGEPLATIDGATGGAGGVRLQDAVGELAVDTGRVDRCYALVHEWIRPADRYYSAALPSQPIFVQRYESAAAASDALDQLLTRSDITRASVDVDLGAQDLDAWTPIYFPYQGQPWSAAIRQTGRHLLVAGVARRPFQQRDEEWAEPLELAWIWGQ